MTCTDQHNNTHDVTETVNTASEVTKPATCEAAGETTFTAAFTNSAFEIQSKTLENVPALEHNWDYANAVFNWSGYGCANATVTCLNDGSHKLTVPVTVTSETTNATCEEDGETFTRRPSRWARIPTPIRRPRP